MQALKDKLEALRQDPSKLRGAAILLALAAVLVVAFAQIRIAGGGDDWRAFMDAARRMVGLEPGGLYTSDLRPGQYLFFNPPWLVIVLLPVLLLPHAWSWAIGSTLTLFLGVLLLRRWLPQPGIIRVALLLLSPPMLYILLHGQVEVIVLAGLLLPAELWWLVVLAKPQHMIGMALAVPVSKWLRAALITAGVFVLTFLLFGNWIQAILEQPRGFMAIVPYNIFGGLWPYQVPVGIGLIALGLSRKDDRFLLASSPFLSPYITMSSMISVWLAVVVSLTEWQAALIFAAWWGAVIYRLVGGGAF